MTAFNKVVNTKYFGWFPEPFGNTGPFESPLVTTITSDRSEPLDVNSGCFTLQMSGDDFGITVYTSSVVKTISVPFFFHLNQHHEFYLLFTPVNSDGD